MTTATQPRSAVADLGLMGVVGTSAVLARPVSANSFVERGKRVTNARRAFGGGDGGAKAEAARKEALASARESTSAAARARRLLDYSPCSSTPDGTGRAVGSNATTPLTSPKKRGTKVDAPPWSPKSPLVSPGMTSPTKPEAPPLPKAPGSVSPTVALAATAAAARVRAAAAAARRDPDPDAPAEAAARGGARERRGCRGGGARAQVQGSAVRRQFKANGRAVAGRRGVGDPGGNAPSPRGRRRARGGAARAESAGQEEASRAARRAAEAEKQNRGRASREAASHAKERRRREIYALNVLLAASERAAAGAAAQTEGNAIPGHLRV